MRDSSEKRILIIRNDKLGDFMLAWPSFAMIKKNCPNWKTYALVPEYTREIAEICPHIDEVLIDPASGKNWKDIFYLSNLIKHHQIDVIITLFSTTKIGITGLLSGVKTRVAPATKIAQIFYPQTLKQRRSRSEKPEYEYNLELIRIFLKTSQTNEILEPEAPYLSFPEQELKQIRDSLIQEIISKKSINYANKEQQDQADNEKIILIHPGSGGSAKNLSLQQYFSLAEKISARTKTTVIFTGGPGEKNLLQEAEEYFPTFQSKSGIVYFAKVIACADLFISGSTGTLHIAGALNQKTVGFYPLRRSATALRWQTINQKENRLSFSLPDQKEDINLEEISEKIIRYFF